MRSNSTIFMTGATGTLGKRFLQDRLQTTDQRIFLLARGKGKLTPEERIRRLLAAYGLDGLLGTRVRVLEGDVTRPGLGLDDAAVGLLRDEADAFYHVAALTTLNAEEGRSRRINVGGTAEALKLAQDLADNGRLGRFFYFSTAYVSGSRRPTPFRAPEDELTPDPAHANHYEASKYEAEGMVRLASARGLPATIFRPSIIVGDSITGEVSEFNVIYPLMKVFIHGILTTLPAHAEDTFNVVPIDFVTRAVGVIADRDDSVGRAYHLVTECPPSIGMILGVKDKLFPSAPAIDLIDPEGPPPPGLGPDAIRMLEPYTSYLSCRMTFATTNTRQALAGSDVSLPRTDAAFLATIMRYAADRGYLLA